MTGLHTTVKAKTITLLLKKVKRIWFISTSIVPEPILGRPLGNFYYQLFDRKIRRYSGIDVFGAQR